MIGNKIAIVLSASTLVVGQNLPTANYARSDAAGVVTNDQWLILGGKPVLGAGAQSTTAATQAVSTTILSLNLTTQNISAIALNNGSANLLNVDRLSVSDQTCEFDSKANKVYCFGGTSSSDSTWYAPGIGVFNPTTVAWEDSVTTTVAPRSGHSSVVLGSTFYIFGGNSSTGVLGDLQSIRFDGLTATRVYTNSFPVARTGHCAAALNSTAFLLVGGKGASGNLLGDAWLFSTVTSDWTDVSDKVGSLPLSRTGQACAKVGNDIAVYGGTGSNGQTYGDMWLVNNRTLASTNSANGTSQARVRRNARRQATSGSATSNPGSRSGAQIAGLNGYAAIAGGQSASDSAVHFYDTENPTSAWVPSTTNLRSLVPGAVTTTSTPAAIPQAITSAAPTSTVAPAATTSAPAPAAQTLDPTIPLPVIVPIPNPVVATSSSTSSATPSSWVPITSPCGASCSDSTLLAVLLAVPIGLCALGGLLAACCAARRAHRKQSIALPNDRDHHESRRHPYHRHHEHHPVRDAALVTRQQEMANHQHHHQQSAAPLMGVEEVSSTALVLATASTAAGADSALTSASSPKSILVARQTPTTRHKTVPGTPKRSDSRRKHSHVPGAAASAGNAGPSTDRTGKVAETHHATMYKCLWKSNPAQPDEIEVRPGDIVEEKRLFADGWALVRNITQGGTTGMVPINILETIPSDHVAVDIGV
ncbi:hypothetical protein HKX48_005600 [Thoreauomyces humboldtii]|nr:hypothetical protein HKX48_005600 [Thoreauomyces humboldtii]